MDVILDTDVCISILRGNYELQELWKRFDNVALTSMTHAELYFGAYRSRNITKHLKSVDFFCSLFESIPFDHKSSTVFGMIKADLHRIGQPLPDADIIIGASAIASERALVSNNYKHFARIVPYGLIFQE